MKRSIPVFFALVFAALTIGAWNNYYTRNGSGDDPNQLPGNEVDNFVAVTAITGVPNEAVSGVELDLSMAKVEPANATNKTISWKVAPVSGSIASTRLTAGSAGKVTLSATITNGKGLGIHYTQDFEITVNDPPASSFTVTFYANGGKFSDDGITHTKYVSDNGSTPVTRPSPDPTRANHVFNGWFTSISGGSAWTFSNPITSSKDLYAQWTQTAPNPGDQKVDKVGDVDIPFRYVPPTPAGGFLREAGKKAVITYGYWISETEVTQELHEEVWGVPGGAFTSGSLHPGETQAKRPTEYLSFYRAIAFCNKLSALTGKTPAYTISGINWATIKYSEIPTSNNSTWNNATLDPAADGYRLPAEMEWLWAAMGATKGTHGAYDVLEYGYQKKYAGSEEGNEPPADHYDYTWFKENSSSKTHQVAKKNANELGIYDMSGNVAEFVWGTPVSTPSGPTVTDFLPTSLPTTTYPGIEPSFMGRSMNDIVATLNTVDSHGNRHNGLNYVGFRILCR